MFDQILIVVVFILLAFALFALFMGKKQFAKNLTMFNEIYHQTLDDNQKRCIFFYILPYNNNR